MKNILITGFTPFDGESINPSYESIINLDDTIMNFQIIKKEIDTSFSQSHLQLLTYIKVYRPVAVILIGQAGGAKHLRIERVAINIQDAIIPDNKGYKPVDQYVIKTAPNAYFSTFPYHKIVENLIDEGIPSSLSYSAGSYVCNHLLFHLLHYLKTTNQNIPAGFIHVPYIFSQVKDKKDVYATDLETLTKAMNIMLHTVIKELL